MINKVSGTLALSCPCKLISGKHKYRNPSMIINLLICFYSTGLQGNKVFYDFLMVNYHKKE